MFNSWKREKIRMMHHEKIATLFLQIIHEIGTDNFKEFLKLLKK